MCIRDSLITLQNRRLKDIAILMYKVKHKLCPTKIFELFNMHCTHYNLRVAVFAIPRFKPLIWDLSWGIDYRAKLGPYRPPTSFKHRVRKCDLKCTWPIIGYTIIWYTGTSFLFKKILIITGVPSLSPLPYPFVVVVFFCSHLFAPSPRSERLKQAVEN